METLSRSFFDDDKIGYYPTHFGMIKYKNGDVYEGSTLFYHRKEGQRQFKHKNGLKYNGLFLNNREHGFGTYTYNKLPTGLIMTWEGELVSYVDFCPLENGRFYRGPCLMKLKKSTILKKITTLKKFGSS